MSAPTEEDPFQDAGTETITMLNAFDNARHGLYEQLSLVAAEQQAIAQYKDEANEKAELAAIAFVDLAKAIFDSDADIDEKKSELTKLWHQDETERVKMMLHLMGCECFDCMSEEDFDDMVSGILLKAESNDNLISLIDDFYRNHMTIDLNTFVNHLEDRREHDIQHGEESIRTLVMLALGKYAVDVTKVAVGTTIALWLHRRLQDKA